MYRCSMVGMWFMQSRPWFRAINRCLPYAIAIYYTPLEVRVIVAYVKSHACMKHSVKAYSKAYLTVLIKSVQISALLMTLQVVVLLEL